ncbi:MAG: aquaporin, partial [Mesorhizobium sp.]
MKTYLAEVLGTFLLVFIGTASVVTGGFGGALPLGQEGIGLAFGIGLIAAAYAIGPISGAHLNPAVTLGVFLAGRMEAKDVIPYWIAQVIGAIIASLALWIIVSGQVGGHTGGFGANGWDATKWGVSSALLWELIGTFSFVTVILGVTSGSHATAFAGLVIGLTLAGLHFAIIPVTGTSL